MSTRWVGDPRIPWRILLTARAVDPVDAASLDRGLRVLYAAQGWGGSPAVETGADLPSLRLGLAGADPAPLRVGLSGRSIVLSAHHRASDGLALLHVLEALGVGPATSSSRGVADRPSGPGLARTVAGRLLEVAVRPPAQVTPPVPVPERPGDVLVEREVAGTFRTADLVHAAAQAVVRHQAATDRSARRIAVAVGAGRPPTPGVVADRSALIRLKDVEGLDRDSIADLVRRAPLQTPPTAGTPRRWTPYVDRAMSLGITVLAPRLGSTVLVSHLGEVSAPALEGLAFSPVTAGGSGVSLGAVSLAGRDRSVLTLRARAAAWEDNGLGQLLEAVVSLL